MREGLIQKGGAVPQKIKLATVTILPFIILPLCSLCLWGCNPNNLQTIDVIPDESLVAALEAKQEEELMRPAADAVQAEGEELGAENKTEGLPNEGKIESTTSPSVNPNPLEEMGFAQSQVPNQAPQNQPQTPIAQEAENVELPDGNSPLHMAILHQDKQGLSILLGMGYDVNGLNNFGETPAILATKGNHYELLLILLEFGANPNLQDMSGNNVRSLVTAQPVEPSSPQFIWRDRVKTVLLGQ